MHICTSEQPVLELGYRDYSVNWGSHVCVLFDSREMADEILFGYLGQGARDGDKMLACRGDRTPEEFVAEWQRRHPEAARAAEHPDTRICTAREIYYPTGTFSPLDMDRSLGSYYEESQRHGPRNVRGIAEMTWALEAVPGAEHLMVYESRLNYFIPGKPWVSLCLYDLARFPGDTIMQVLQVHPFVLSRAGLSRNPYYLDPDHWLKEHAPEFVPA